MNNYEIRLLSDLFYEKYNNNDYPEMEEKTSRPFLVLLVEIDDNKFAIPFRTNIRHKYCYKFANTNRLTESSTALDFSKAVIVNDSKYIGVEARIDQKEFVELSSKSIFIINKFKNFIEKYKKIMLNPQINYYEYDLLCKYSTLKYFHNELGI